jgi:N-acylneuraminate cytidylyltransferase
MDGKDTGADWEAGGEVSIAIIPARGGSQRIPRKNIRMFHGRPVISYSIETAQKTGWFNQIIVSTDDVEIAAVATQYGALTLFRPPEMSTNEIGTQEVMQYVLRSLDPDRQDSACCLYATAPLLRVEDLRRGFSLLRSHNSASFAFSVGTSPLRDAGQFYWGWSQAFIRGDDLHANAVMVPINEDRVCDINTEDDWLRAEQMYLALRGNNGN